MEQTQGFQAEQRTLVLPRLIEASYLLQLSSQSLEAVVATELQTNPALEMNEAPSCDRCGAPLESGSCVVCTQSSPSEPDRLDGQLLDTEFRQERQYDGDLDDDQFSSIASSPSLAEQVSLDAFASLDSDDHPLVTTIVDAIDHRGWLSITTKELATITGRSTVDVERVLRVVQELAPAGVGARNLPECLRLQVGELSQQGIVAPKLITMFTEHDYEDLGAHRYQVLAKRLGVTSDEIDEAHAFIRSQLTPNPLQERAAAPWRHVEETATRRPDVIVRIIEDEIAVALIRGQDTRLSVNPDYVWLSKQPKSKSAADAPGAPLSEDERDHVRSSVRSARDFISRLEQRRRTLLNIATVVCSRQEAFLRGTVRDLQPLTRSDVAAELDINESTVSRATSDKYVLLPTRKVIPFSDFFTASLSVKDVMREIIAGEANRGKSLSDQQICDQLQERGYRIARRTVTKYRLQLDILPSTHRHIATATHP